MLQALRNLLLEMVHDIDNGSCNMSEEDCAKLIKAAQSYTRKDRQWSKYQAYTFLNISRATFDRMVKEGDIPKGHKVQGFKELFWNESDIRRLTK